MTVLRVCYKHGVRFDESYYFSKHLPVAGNHLSPFLSMPPPFRLTDVQFLDERSGRPKVFLDRVAERFRLLA